MKNTGILSRLLVGVSLCAMVYLFFHQARLVLKPIPIAFHNTDIAYGYTAFVFTGTVYHDEGQTPVGAGSSVTLDVNGTTIASDNTDENGVYLISDDAGFTMNAHDVLTVFLGGETEKAVMVAKFDDTRLNQGGFTGMDLYIDRLILRTESADLNITTNDLKIADDGGDTDVSAMFSFDGNDLKLSRNKELLITSGTTHTASGALYTHDLEVDGTLTMGTGNVTASGSVVAHGVVTLTGDMTLSSVDSGELLLLKSSAVENLVLDNGLEAYFRMDEGTGTNASGSTLNIGTGGSLTNSPTFVQTNTGTTLFYNPYAVEFDGSDDSIVFNDSFDLTTSKKKTFTTWFRRKSLTTDDVIFSKKTASGSSNAGYILYIDDSTDKVVFELANGSSTYTVTSNSAITNQKWHHVAVTYDPLNNDGTNIFLSGSINVASKAGSMNPSSHSTANAVNFIIGNDAGSKAPFEGTIDDFRIYSRHMTGDELSVLATGTKTTGSGTYYLGSTLDVNGDLSNYSQVLDAGTGYTIQVEEDWNAYGLIRTNTGSVTLDGTTQTLRGSSAFRHISKTVTASTTLTFESNVEQTVSGSLTLQGATSNPLSLRASVTGVDTYLIVEGSGATTTLEFLDVKDNNAFSGKLLSCASGCIDSSNNTNWEFLGACQDGIVNDDEECDDGNAVNTDSCPNDCKLAVCGDDVVEGREQCEPPNSGTCQSNCIRRGSGGGGGGGGASSNASTASFYNRPEPPDGCGNGILDEDKGEECDAGTRFNGLGTCSFNCKLLVCGDGTISPQIGEDCEPVSLGLRNGVQTFEVATCGETCTAPEISDQGTLIGGCNRMFLAACGTTPPGGGPLKPSAPAACGNGTVEPGEECDFGGVCEGGQFDGSFWTDRNSASTCVSGGGTTKAVSGDGCTEDCKTEFCGDGVLQERGADNQPNTSDDEECDNGSICSTTDSISCRLNDDCLIGTTCDYNVTKDRSCSSQCKIIQSTPKPSAPSKPSQPSQPAGPVCGNGKVESAEECDEGAKNGKPNSTCSSTCTNQAKPAAPAAEPRCGDGTQDAGEECDDGDKNSDVSPNACRTNCKRPFCGDFIQDSNEECDNGDGNSNLFGDTCRTNCILPYCGDGILDSNEECDSSLTCQPNCRNGIAVGSCGNAKIENGEKCDDGNRTSGDGCSRFCQLEELKPSAPEPKKEQPIVEEDAKPIQEPVEEFDADVVVVNPTEIANALSFIGTANPCSTLVVKGQELRAESIREVATRKGIPIVKNIPLARALFESATPGEKIFGNLCEDINGIKKDMQEEEEPATPELPPPPKPQDIVPLPPKELPQAPTMLAQGYYPYAQVTPLVVAQPPVGDTGPGLIGIGITGAAAGMGWMRRRKKAKQ